MTYITTLSLRHNVKLDRYQIYIELSNGESILSSYPAISSTGMAAALKDVIYWLDKGGEKVARYKG